VPLSEVVRLLDEMLQGAIAKILDVSSHAMTMVTALDKVQPHIGLVEQCIGRIDKINRTTNLLALNAMIEAARAGEHGKPFTVVAGEVKELSRATNELAAMMRAEVGAIVEGLQHGNAILREVAGIDMTEQKLTKERLDLLLRGLLHRRTEVEALIKDASCAAGAIERDIGQIIVGIQFQDRSKQRLDHVVDALAILDEAVGERHGRTSDGCGGEPDVDSDWLKSLVDRCTMGEVRKRFVAQLLTGRPIGEEAPGGARREASEGGDIELF
jgi:methyl-accepting chemotaxis protein